MMTDMKQNSNTSEIAIRNLEIRIEQLSQEKQSLMMNLDSELQ